MDWKIEVIAIPVSDVDRAKAFYVDQCGFHLDHEARPSADMRIVQITPTGSACSIVFGSGLPTGEPGSAQGSQIVVSDIDAAHDFLVKRGVDVTPVRHMENGEWKDGRGDNWGTFCFFKDPDGNGWSIQQGGSR